MPLPCCRAVVPKEPSHSTAPSFAVLAAMETCQPQCPCAPVPLPLPPARGDDQRGQRQQRGHRAGHPGPRTPAARLAALSCAAQPQRNGARARGQRHRLCGQVWCEGSEHRRAHSGADRHRVCGALGSAVLLPLLTSPCCVASQACLSAGAGGARCGSGRRRRRGGRGSGSTQLGGHGAGKWHASWCKALTGLTAHTTSVPTGAVPKWRSVNGVQQAALSMSEAPEQAGATPAQGDPTVGPPRPTDPVGMADLS